ncbi:hypothetical protein RJT34_12826 [Clitoria ternatea]|uniref:Uroporphyrinogen decarboxylase (URO-D) domain-containing protein n=1 Tax=Clitoria ternatea TaxID=43366 RepID=A0AAN9JPK7_CLITE
MITLGTNWFWDTLTLRETVEATFVKISGANSFEVAGCEGRSCWLFSSMDDALGKKKAFRPDGVIISSNILTPLPAFGVEFNIKEVKGPVIHSPIRSEEGLKNLHPIVLERLEFVGESLKILRQEVGGHAVVLGFVGAPWTIATYIVEGGTTRTYTTIKSICHTAPYIVSHLTQTIDDYIMFQVESGAHCI